MRFTNPVKFTSALKFSAQRLYRIFTVPVTQAYRKVYRLVNPNGFTSRVMADVRKSSKDLLKTKEQTLTNYFDIGSHYVSKKLVLFVVILLILLPVIYLSYGHPLMQKHVLTTDLVVNSADMMTHTGKVRLHQTPGGLTLYHGDMTAGRITGNGTLYNYDGELVYKGAFLNEKFDGAGETFYPNGNLCYAGTFLANKYEGQGQSFYENGNLQYEGTFALGMYEGEGTLYDEGGDVLYVGTFAKGLYDGMGRLYQNGALLYQGGFVAGKMEGMGRVYAGDFVTYEGGFSADSYAGVGKLYDVVTKSLVYDGTFENGQYSGEGVLFDPQTAAVRYTGGFYQGEFSGEGSLYNPRNNQLLYAGTFRLGRYDGAGTLYDPATAAALYVGDFLLGQLHGAGTIYDPQTGYVAQAGEYRYGQYVIPGQAPVEPGIPTIPTIPGDPTIPTDPAIPGNPADPVIPSDPTTPTVPTDPVTPPAPSGTAVYTGPKTEAGTMDVAGLVALENPKEAFATPGTVWSVPSGGVSVYSDVTENIGVSIRTDSAGAVVAVDVWNDAPVGGVSAGMSQAEMDTISGGATKTYQEQLGTQRMISISQSNRYFNRLTNLSPESNVTIREYETAAGTVRAMFMAGQSGCILLEMQP